MTIESKLILSIILSILATKYLIPVLVKMKVGQPIREEGNKEHYKKAGTPTMGGIGFVGVFILLSIFLLKPGFDLIMVIVATLAFAAIGFIDDYSKIKKKENEGLNEKQKLTLQFSISFILALLIYLLRDNMGYLIIPFSNRLVFFGIFVIPIITIAFVGATNAVNLTDGIDGLLASVSIPVFIGIYIISAANNRPIAHQAIIFAGVLLGFLAFNSNPASVFMGDTGSMAIGGAITAMMVLLNNSLYLIILGGVFVAEALSLIIQVISFKTRGKRVFLMSPFHHHFELKGYKEPKIVAAFMLASIIFTSLTIYLMRV
ncbi:MAG: phospho-N-acetylmuramoyl-pentapeptide-transferase [Tissierellia bacterium]|nr:phospho-N-acetylmuramoyl-pentapeptide-transferase [Tissierellia bacterium]